jgi:hypothetical protein
MAIYKTIITVTVLSTLPLEFDSLEELGREIDSGDSIGNVEVGSHIKLDQDRVNEELLNIGNDGTFFDDVDVEFEVE